MAVAKWCGHDSRGLAIPFDDIPAIRERYEKFKQRGELDYDHLGFTLKQSQIIDRIYLPIYYNPEIQRNLDSLKDDYNLITVGASAKCGLVSLEWRRGGKTCVWNWKHSIYSHF